MTVRLDQPLPEEDRMFVGTVRVTRRRTVETTYMVKVEDCDGCCSAGVACEWAEEIVQNKPPEPEDVQTLWDEDEYDSEVVEGESNE